MTTQGRAQGKGFAEILLRVPHRALPVFLALGSLADHSGRVETNYPALADMVNKHAQPRDHVAERTVARSVRDLEASGCIAPAKRTQFGIETSVLSPFGGDSGCNPFYITYLSAAKSGSTDTVGSTANEGTTRQGANTADAPDTITPQVAALPKVAALDAGGYAKTGSTGPENDAGYAKNGSTANPPHTPPYTKHLINPPPPPSDGARKGAGVVKTGEVGEERGAIIAALSALGMRSVKHRNAIANAGVSVRIIQAAARRMKSDKAGPGLVSQWLTDPHELDTLSKQADEHERRQAAKPAASAADHAREQIAKQAAADADEKRIAAIIDEATAAELKGALAVLLDDPTHAKNAALFKRKTHGHGAGSPILRRNARVCFGSALSQLIENDRERGLERTETP